MILNILVLVGIILIVVTIVAYKSKRQIVPSKCDHEHNEPLVDVPVATPSIISSDYVADTQPSGSIEYIKEHI